MSKTAIKKYLAEIGKKGGKANTPAQKVARSRNSAKGGEARAIQDEFSHLPRRERYAARKKRDKLMSQDK